MMNKRLYILILMTALCCLILFTLYPTFKLSKSMAPYHHQASFANKAFATVLFDPIEVLQIQKLK